MWAPTYTEILGHAALLRTVILTARRPCNTALFTCSPWTSLFFLPSILVSYPVSNLSPSSSNNPCRMQAVAVLVLTSGDQSISGSPYIGFFKPKHCFPTPYALIWPSHCSRLALIHLTISNTHRFADASCFGDNPCDHVDHARVRPIVHIRSFND